MRLEILTKNTGWYGSHSGYYERLPEHLARIHLETRITRPVNAVWARFIGKVIAVRRRPPRRNQSLTFAEELFAWRYDPGRSVGHLMCFEDNAHILERWVEAPRSLIATIHYPPTMWDETLVRAAKRLRSAIVLYRRDIPSFEKWTGKDRVRFVPHGVDLNFFQPSTAPPANPPRLAYIGQFGRNPAMLARVAERLFATRKDLQLDVVIACRAFVDDNFKSLRDHPRVRFHHGISDAELRTIYQRATALLLPMNESGANNAIVEATACGLPVATTDVGGIWDYGGGTIYPLALNNDDDALIEIATRYLDDHVWWREIGRNLRDFAEQHLSWDKSARLHLQACNELAGMDVKK